MIALLGTVLAASLAGSVHCAGMCGGIATVSGGCASREACGSNRAGIRKALAATLMYHAARLGGYATAGAVAGSIGAALQIGGELLGIQRLAGIVAGVSVMLAGVAILLHHGGFSSKVAMPRGLERVMLAGTRWSAAASPGVRAAALGGLSVLLPCGWLWAFLAVAAGAGSPIGGALVMAVFWVGTVPILVAIGMGVQFVGGLWRGRVAVIAALAMIVVGLHAMLLASSRGDALGDFDLRAAGDASGAIHRVHAASEELPPCCRSENDEAAAESSATQSSAMNGAAP